MLCQMLVIVPFLFLSLVVVAYSEPVGWVAVVLTCFGFLITIGMWAQWVLEPASPSKSPLFCD
jgi:hypothetical protein